MPPGPAVTPEGGECPINLGVSQQPPTISTRKIAPASPIVVEQDPARRGVDVTDRTCQNQPGYKWS